MSTDGSRRLYAISGLQKGKQYQVKIAALTVNGTGPSTGWLYASTFESDLDETVVPDPTDVIDAFAVTVAAAVTVTLAVATAGSVAVAATPAIAGAII